VSLKKQVYLGPMKYLKIATKPGKIPELDGLRAVAILLVLCHHFSTFYREHNGSYYKQVFSGVWHHFIQNGWLGVDLFFVLSGYLIFHHLSASADKAAQKNLKPDYGRYALKRILRTFPLYYAMIALVALGAIPYYSATVTATSFWLHVVFLQDYFVSSVLVPMWSLATEEKFYLLAPLLLFMNNWRTHKSVFFLLVIVAVLMLWRSLQISQINEEVTAIGFFESFRAPFHFAIISILVGVGVALTERLKHEGQTKRDFMPLVGLLAGALVITVMLVSNLYRGPDWQMVHWLHFAVVLSFGVIMWVSVTYTGARWLKPLTGRFLRVVAVLSYALYLVHYAILPWALHWHRSWVSSEVAWVHASTFVLIYLSLTVVFALLLHYLVEKPFLLLKDKI